MAELMCDFDELLNKLIQEAIRYDGCLPTLRFHNIKDELRSFVIQYLDGKWSDDLENEQAETERLRGEVERLESELATAQDEVKSLEQELAGQKEFNQLHAAMKSTLQDWLKTLEDLS